MSKLLHRLKKAADKQENNEVYIALLREGLSPSLCWQLCKGTYKHELKGPTLKAVEEALKKVG